MQAKILRGLSQACMVAGDLSLIGAVAVYAWGRTKNDLTRMNDGIFVGLWVPTFYVLSDRAALAAKELEDQEVLAEMGPSESMDEQRQRAQEVLPRGTGATTEQARQSSGHEREKTQSPRPLQYTRKQ